MSFKKIANAELKEPILSTADWEKMYGVRTFGHKTASFNKIAADSSRYLLSHCTIMASVMTEEEPFEFLIKPECSHLVNNNDDAWENQVLKLSHRSFIGAFNFVEHFQNSKYAKGHILDSVLRKVQITGPDCWVYFCDILVATDIAHEQLVTDIRDGRVSYLSMGCVTDLVICSYCGAHVTDQSTYCGHLNYQKGTFLVDDDGISRRVAELCFPPDTRLVLHDGTRTNIQSVQTGQEVLTHTGARKKVTRTFSRPYEGKMVSLKVQGVPQPLVSTPNHPYWVLSPREICLCGCGKPLRTLHCFHKREYARGYLQGHNIKGEYQRGLGIPDFEFKEADTIKLGDLLALPIPEGVIAPQDVTSDKAELLGWFLAEGCYIKNEGEYTGISLTLNATDELDVASHLKDLMNSSFPSSLTSAHIYCYDRTKEGGEKLVVNYRNKEAAAWCLKHAGEYAATKKLSEDAIFWPLELQYPLLQAYVKGDGTVDEIGRHSVASISEDLISQMQIIAARCGMWTRRQVIFNGKTDSLIATLPVNGTLPVDSNNFRPLHTLHFSPSDETSEFFSTLGSTHVRGIGAKWRKHLNYMLYRVTASDLVDYSGTVHNIEVEDDHSYLVEGLAAHNCGHHTLPNGGVKFVEASWVGTPAFPGAIKRSIVAEEWVGPATKYTSPIKSASLNGLFSKAASGINPIDAWLDDDGV